MMKDNGIHPGDVFGRLTVVEQGPSYITPSTGRKRYQYYCKCSCGNEKLVLVAAAALKCGRTRSCGCLARESASRTGKANTTNGISKTPEAQAYYNMRNRCRNQNYQEYNNYGGRGICICERWADPENGIINFYNDMHPTYFPGASLDRIDVNDGYSPENCRWVTAAIQANNMTTNVNITIGDTTYTASEWNRAMGYSKDKIGHRLRSGWDPIQAVFGNPEATHGASTAHNAVYFVDQFGHPCLDQQHWQDGNFDDSEFEKLK